MKIKHMPIRITGKIFFLLGVFLGTGVYLLGCGGRGDTANSSDPNAGIGRPYVASQGGGSTIRIDLDGSGNEIQVAGQRGFRVTLTDPHGSPINHVRVFCESEKGIAILEPSSGGVAFAHTNVNGVMSGLLGGLLPGSYMLECRAPHGFDLVARMHIRITGSVPQGFVGFPGAAGGNLGGGAVIPPQSETGTNVFINQLQFNTETSPGPQPNPPIDVSRGQCGLVNEPFGPDQFVMNVTNNSESTVTFNSVSVAATLSNNVQANFQVSVGENTLAPSVTRNLSANFTQVSGSSKQFVETSTLLVTGRLDLRFTIQFTNAEGDIGTAEATAALNVEDLDACNN
jgi:hypothetical protein